MFPEEYLKKIPEDQHAAAEDVLSVLYETKKENKMGHSIADWGLMIADPKSEIRNPKSKSPKSKSPKSAILVYWRDF